MEKTYTRITKKNGLAKLKISLRSNIYSVTIKYAGKGNYMPVSKSTKSKCAYKQTYRKNQLWKGILHWTYWKPQLKSKNSLCCWIAFNGTSNS